MLIWVSIYAILVTNTHRQVGGLYFIQYVRVTGCIGYTTVQLTNQIGAENTAINGGTNITTVCTFNDTLLVYQCDNTYSYEFVSLFPLDTIVSCQIQAYTELFQYCGLNGTTNEAAGRFFDKPPERGPETNLDQQYAGVCTSGCTNTECMCNSNYGGALCGLSVSTIRPVTVERNGQDVTVGFVFLRSLPLY